MPAAYEAVRAALRPGAGYSIWVIAYRRCERHLHPSAASCGRTAFLDVSSLNFGGAHGHRRFFVPA